MSALSQKPTPKMFLQTPDDCLIFARKRDNPGALNYAVDVLERP